MTSQRGLLKVTILTNVPNLAKMANMAKIRQPLNYVPNKIAKRPLGRWRIWRNSPKMWLNFLWDVQRLPFNSGDFDENGKHGDMTKKANSSFSPNLPFLVKITTFQETPLDITFQFSPNLSFSQFAFFVTRHFSRGTFGHPWIFAKSLTKFRQICHFRCCMHFWSYEKLAGLLLLKEIEPPLCERN